MFGLIKEKRLIELQKKYDELKLKLNRCKEIEATNNTLSGQIQKLHIELAELKKQLREQIEADLFFISAKIQKKLLDGEPKENMQDVRLQQIAYQNQLAQMQQQSPYPNTFLSGLGLGGLFGTVRL